MVYRLTLSYCGTAYAGWQRQKNARAVQQVVEEALGQLLSRQPRIHGAGRTDAGVHALGQIAHFQIDSPFPARGLVHGGNRFLPRDIRILAAHRMPGGFHARKQALGKEYRYRVYRGSVPPATLDPFVAPGKTGLDCVAMRAALALLPGRHDFTAFALAGGAHTQPFRRIFTATLEEYDREICFRFLGEGFLRGMVRSLVGTLLEIGLGKRPVASMAELLTGRRRSEAGPTAAAKGLLLHRVFYPPRLRPLSGYTS